MNGKGRFGAGFDDVQMIGWIEAGAFVIALSLLNVLYAYALAKGANVIVFVLYAMIGTSALMLLMSGIGRDAWSIIKAPQSWIFGIASVALEAVYFLLVGLISPAEASLTARLSVPASLFIGWWLFGARISSRQTVGGLIVVAAVIPILVWVSPDHRAMATLLGVLCALAVAVKTFASEFHPWNLSAESIDEKIRITGLVVLSTTAVGLVVTGVAMLAANLGVTSLAAIAPPVSAFTHGPTILLALVFGSTILGAMTYLQFSSVVKIGTANFLALSALAPLAAYALQIVAAWIGLIVVPPFELAVLFPILAGIAGVLLIVQTGNGRGSPRGE